MIPKIGVVTLIFIKDLVGARRLKGLCPLSFCRSPLPRIKRYCRPTLTGSYLKITWRLDHKLRKHLSLKFDFEYLKNYIGHTVLIVLFKHILKILVHLLTYSLDQYQTWLPISSWPLLIIRSKVFWAQFVVRSISFDSFNWSIPNLVQGLHPISRWSLLILRSHVQRSRTNPSAVCSISFDPFTWSIPN